MRRAVLAVIAVLAAGAAGAQPVQPQAGPDSAAPRPARLGQPAGPPLSGAELEQLTEELSSLMRCPVCQGLSVADSPTPLASAMKNEVRELLAAGYDRTQVLDYFEQSYGEFIRLAPRAEGFNLTVWLAPAVLLLAGFGLILARRRSGTGHRQPEPAEDSELAAYRERVRREVAP